MSPPTRHFHRAFGLRIASSSTLAPYFEEVGEPLDGDIDLRVEAGEGGLRTPESLEMEWPGLVRVHAQAGRRIWVTPVGRLSERAVAEMICGPVIAVALAQRGLFVLHGSAVEIGGRVVAMCGHSGAGKSTMAAMFAAVGARSFSDDVTPLATDADAAGVEAVAGPTLAKLAAIPPAARPFLRELGAEALGEKTLCAWVNAALPGERAPLAAVLLVEDAPEVSLVPLRGQEALSELLRFSFCLTTGGARRQAQHLQAAAHIAAQVPVMRWQRSRSFAGAAGGVEAVVRKFAAG